MIQNADKDIECEYKGRHLLLWYDTEFDYLKTLGPRAMLDRALSIYSDQNSTPIYMGKLQGYISTLNTRRVEIAGRYRYAPGTESEGIVLLRHVLAQAQIPELLAYEDDSDRMIKGLYPVRTDLERIFDPVTTGIVRDSLFIARLGSRTTEVIIPVQMTDPLKTLPLDKGWSHWEKVRPLRLIDVDSNELTFNTFKDQIQFKQDQPNRAVFTVDVVALCMQYAKFLELHDGVPPIPVQEYLHRYVFLDAILSDLQNIWLRNRYTHILMNPSEEMLFAKDITNSIYHNIYGYLGLQYTAAMEEVYRLLTRTSAGTATPSRIVASFRTSDGYIPEYYMQLRESAEVAKLRQHGWVEYLRDFPWLKMAYYTYKLNPEFVGYQSFIRHFTRDLNLLLRTRFWSTIHDSQMRQDIENEVRALSEWTAQESLDIPKIEI